MDSKKLRKKYMPLVSKLNNALKYVQSQFSDLPPSEFQLESNVKPYASVKRKMETDQIDEPAELSDLVRGRLFFSPQFNHPEVIDIVKHLFGDKVTGVDKKPQKSKEHGLEYHGVTHVDMNIDGIRFELQIMPAEFRPHKEFLHQIYEKFRDPKIREKLTDKQKEFLRKTHNKMYKDLEKKSKTESEES
jgi:hypothetical protein